MKRAVNILMLVIFFTISCSSLSYAQKIAQATMGFLNIDVGARASAMGGAFVTMNNDASDVFYNPAGLGYLNGGSVSFNNTNWIADMKQYAFAVAYGTDLYGTFGVSFIMMDNGTFERTMVDETADAGYVKMGTFDVGQWAFGVSYAKKITDKFSFGGQVKYALQDLGAATIWNPRTVAREESENREGALVLDFGTLYETGFRDLKLGMTFRNFSRQIRYSNESIELPLTFKIGASMDILNILKPYDSASLEQYSLQLVVEAIHPRDFDERIHVGGEFWYRNFLALRSGYKFNYDEESITYGFGLNPDFTVMGLSFDYSYSDFGEVFGSVQRFSIGFTF